jgi:2-methylcitrate dehydratase PrpD
MSTVTETPLLARVAAFASLPLEGELGDRIVADVRRRVRDLVGISLAALESESARVVGGLVESWGGTPQAGCIGRPARLPAPSAALWGGTLAHALDYDDTHLPSVLHPSACVVPAALAAAEAAGAPGERLVPAVAVGDELCIRLGMAGYDRRLANSVFFEKGLHATAICGALGAAAAAASCRGMDAEGIGHAVSIAASMGSGLIEANRTGGSVKQVHCGWAAHAGVTAAELAARGLTGPPTVIEGRFGFLRAFCDDRAYPEAVVDGLGESWELLRLHFKPYPANHFTHAGIDAALQLREAGVHAAEVEEVELAVASAVLRTIAEPADEKARPESGYAAKFSGPYTFAAALAGGGGLGLGLEDFADGAARDPERLELAAKVRCVADPECDELFPNAFPAIARVRTANGDRHEVRVMQNRGGPDRPLSDDELDRKFRENASRALDAGEVDRLDALLARLESSTDVRELLDATRRAGG